MFSLVLVQYHNVPKVSDREVWANSVDLDQTAPALNHFVQILGGLQQIVWMSEILGSLLYVMKSWGCWFKSCTVKPPCLNFRVITANVSGVRIFRIFMVH